MSTKARGSRQSRLAAIRKRRVIRVAATWSNTAEQYLDPDTREPMGVVGHVGRLLAADLGVTVEFVDVPWGDQLSALESGRVDICLKHTNRPDRAFVVDFCQGRLERYEGKIVIRRDSAIGSERDLNDPSRTIAATAGSHQEMQVRERYPAARLRTYANAHEGMLGVLRREADACLADASIPNFLLLHTECTVLHDGDGRPLITSVDFAHPCIKAGDQTFLNWLNNWMDFHHVQGTFEKLISQSYREHEAKFQRIMEQFEQVGSAPAARASSRHGRS